MEQLDLDNWREEKPEEKTGEKGPVLESLDCQYCQDVGSCMYCRRGQEFVTNELKFKAKRKKPRKAKKAA